MMKLAVLMSLVAMALGRPTLCDDYCKTVWFSTQLPPPWDPLCDCTKRPIPSKSFNGKPVYTAATIFKIDDTGIYFEPANMQQVDGVTYINQPFYVVNTIDDFITQPPITVTNKAARRQNPELKMVKYNTKNNAKLDDSNTYKSYLYSYRKEDVPQAKTDYKIMDQDNIEDLHKTGQSLSKCVDLYMMAKCRIYNNGSELAKIWGKSKYHKFNKLSNEDLMVTMRQECNKTEDFETISEQDIIGKQPKKKDVSKDEGSTPAKQNKPFLEPNYMAKAESVDEKSKGMVRPLMNNDKRNIEDYYYMTNFSIHNNMHGTDSPHWITSDDLKTAIESDDSNKINTYQSFEKFPNSTIASQFKDGIETATMIYAKDRSTYNENEVPPQKVITREFANDVVKSVIDGIEDLQRDDSSDDHNEDTHNPLEASLTGGPIGPVQVNMRDQEIPLLMGNLYFRFGEDYIPATFVQKSDGKLHVAIDGATICAKINLARDNQSPGLSGLCDNLLNNQYN